MSDLALPTPAPIDRRILVRLLLAGATGVTIAEAGIVTPAGQAGLWEGPQLAIDSVRRTLAGLAAGYDAWGPQRVAAATRTAEVAMHGVFVGFRDMTDAQMGDAKAVYAQLLTMSATAADDTGRHTDAFHAGHLAASLAYEVGDVQTVGHAWSVVASAMSNSGKGRAAIAVAQRAHTVAAHMPSGVMALAEEAATAAKIGDVHTVLEAATAAEEAHAALPEEAWGTPGYSLGSFHGAKMFAFVGWSLAKVGLHRDAAPRLEAAADLAAGTGLLVYVRLAQARASAGVGDVDAAHDYAAMAVASAEPRPAAWVDREVRDLDRRTPGAFADLAEQTSRWGFAVT